MFLFIKNIYEKLKKAKTKHLNTTYILFIYNYAYIVHRGDPNEKNEN